MNNPTSLVHNLPGNATNTNAHITQRQGRRSHQQVNQQGHPQGRSQQHAVPQPPALPSLSKFSSPAVSSRGWASCDFLLGAGMVVIQKNSHKIVVLYDKKDKVWFFPRGRKDTCESLEQTALREAYEESGFKVAFLHIMNPHNQPISPLVEDKGEVPGLTAEPIFISIHTYSPKQRRNGNVSPGGEYLTTWYAGEIPEDAVQEPDTRMPDEQNYETHLLSIDEAMSRVWGVEVKVLHYVWSVYCHTLDCITLHRERTTDIEEVPSATEDDLHTSVST